MRPYTGKSTTHQKEQQRHKQSCQQSIERKTKQSPSGLYHFIFIFSERIEGRRSLLMASGVYIVSTPGHSVKLVVQ